MKSLLFANCICFFGSSSGHYIDLFNSFCNLFFVDAAIEALQGGLVISNLYIPLGILLTVVALSRIIDHLLGLLNSRLKMVLKLHIEPNILEIRASFKYNYIEDSEGGDLVERLSENIIVDIQEGVRALTIVLRSMVSIVSILALIMTHLWWAAVLIGVLSIPLFWIC